MIEQPVESPGHVPERYVCVWEFHVSPAREKEFVALYGPSGEWAQLFRQAEGYIETLLLRDQQVPGRFLTVDRWRSQRAHDMFLASFGWEYEALDRRCASLTEYEANLGSYWEHLDQAG
jgi:quinol monooxygenase YgiN